MSKHADVLEKIKACEKSAQTFANPETRHLSEKQIPVGKHAWQGDVAFQNIGDVPKDAKLQRNRTVRQVVEGTTRGARHCVTIESFKGVMWYTPAKSDVLTGDIMQSDSTIEIEHPEHGNIVLPPGAYQIRYQRAYSPLEEMKRQRD